MYRFILSLPTTIILLAIAGCCLPPAQGGQGEAVDLFSQIDFPISNNQKARQPNKIPSGWKANSGHLEKAQEKTQEKAQGKTKNYVPKKLAALGELTTGNDEAENYLPSEKKRSTNKKTNRAELTLLRTVSQVTHPQSIIFDPNRLRFYVSRLGDKAADKEGAIALLARDGGLINKAYIKGLNQPRGLAVSGPFLYVADGKNLVQIDIDSAKIINKFEDKDAFYFNDVVASKTGEVYVTDPLTNSINKLTKDGTFNLFLQDPVLSGPNSLVLEGDHLYVGSMGLKSGDPKKPGEVLKAASAEEGGLFKISLTTKKINKLSNQALPQIASIGLDGEGHIYAVGAGASELLKFTLIDGRLAERINVQKLFKLSDTQGLGDFHYFTSSKEFWVPVKNNGHILVFVRSDATLASENE